MPIRVADIAEYLAGRCRVYDDAFAADLRRLRAAHGASTVIDALRLLEQHAASCSEHKQAVREGVERTLAGRGPRLQIKMFATHGPAMALPPTTDQTRADGFRRRAIELAEEARNEARPGGGSLIDKARSSIAPADMLAPELPPEPQIFRKLRSMGV